MTTRDAAIEYITLYGWPVFPLRPDKRPLPNPPGTPRGKGGFHLATRDIDRVRAKWKDEYLIGIPTGRVSGLVVVDADDAASVAWVRERDGRPPHVLTSRGAHWYYAQPARAVRKSVHRIGKSQGLAIDVQSDGGYVAAPPGPSRQWVGDREPYEWPAWLDEMPETVVRVEEKLPPARPRIATRADLGGHATPYGARALERGVAEIMRARKGERNPTINSVSYSIGRAVGAGQIEYRHAVIELRHAVRAIGAEPKELEVVERAVRDGIRNPRRIRD